MALTREGHPAAFDEIVRRYRGPLVSYAATIVPAHRAEEAVQDALASTYLALTESSAEIHLRAWLFTIVRNRALNSRRDEPLDAHLDESYDGVPQPPQLAAQREELARLVAALQALPTAQREAIVKRELEGLSHGEIAAALGVTPGAVRQLIFRARAALRNCAGVLVPMPLLRALVEAQGAETAGLAAGGGGATAGAALAASSGGGIAAKGGIGLVIGILALGSGLALREDDRGGAGKAAAESGDAAPKAKDSSVGSALRATSSPGERGTEGGDSGAHARTGGAEGHSGPGGGEDDQEQGVSGGSDLPQGRGGPAADGEEDRHSGPGGSGARDDAESDDGEDDEVDNQRSGPRGKNDPADRGDDDRSGPGWDEEPDDDAEAAEAGDED